MSLLRQAVVAAHGGRCRAPDSAARSPGRKPIRRSRSVWSSRFGAGSAPDIMARLDGAMDVGPARSAVRRREPAGRRQHHRHRRRRARARPMATRCCWHARPMRSTRRFTTIWFQFHARYRAGHEHRPMRPRHGGASSIPAKNDPRIHRLCQGQSGQDQYGVGRHGTPPHLAGELFKMMAGVDLVHVPYRAEAGAMPIYRAGRCK